MGIDDDGDGRIDEDLATFPPTIEIDDAYYEYESCVFEVRFMYTRENLQIVTGRYKLFKSFQKLCLYSCS